MSSKVTYRQQYTRCGKERCRKCKEGAGHGPYWYAYWSEHGRTLSKYVGIHLPSNIEIDHQGTEDAKGHNEARQETQSLSATPALPIPASPAKPSALPDCAEKPGAKPRVYLSMQRSVASTSSDTQPIAKQISEVPLQLNTQILRIYVLGQFRVEHLRGSEWSPVLNRTWQRRRARALLGCLLSNTGRRMRREQIMEALWPNLDSEIAANRLNGAVHELRQILEPDLARPAMSRMLRLERDMLALADSTSIWVDTEAFEHLVNEVNTLWGQATTVTSTYRSLSAANAEQLEHLLKNAAALYVGDYLLEELYSEWAAPRREALRRSWTGVLLKLSELCEARGALTTAIEPLNRLLATDPTDETTVQRLMLLLTQLDRRGEALQTYRSLVHRLQQNYDSEPLSETRELYEKICQGHIGKASQPKIMIASVDEQKNISTDEGTTFEPVSAGEAIQAAQSKAATGDISLSQVVARFVRTSQLGRSNQKPLVGRVREMETMCQLLLSLEGSTTELPPSNTVLNLSVIRRHEELKTPHMMLLMGEAGIGKTRLAEELSHEAYTRGWAVAWTRAYEQGAIPYRPWIELLRLIMENIPTDMLVSTLETRMSEEASAAPHPTLTILARLSTLLPELRELLPSHGKPYPQLPPEQERFHLWEATLGLLSTLSRIKPLLLVLDDLHWTDGSSCELLAYLTRHIQDQHILLLGTCRDGELSPGHGLRTLIADLRREQAILTIPVQPLTQSQIGSLVAHLPPNIVQSIQTQAAGNPFFAEELARASEATLLTSSNADFVDGGQRVRQPIRNDENARETLPSGSTLPEGIAAVLDRRLDRLSNECQQLLGKAAVLGGSFELSQLVLMTNEQNEDALLDLLEEALQAGLLTEEGMGAHITYHFWHPLIVSHLYERLSAARCAQLHRRAATALLKTHKGHEGEVAAAVTNHLSKGGSDPMEIAHYAELAGTQAYSLSAYAEAEQYYLQTVKTLTSGKLPLKDSAGVTTLHQVDNSLAYIAEPLHIARLLEHVAECSVVQGNFEEARNFYECVLKLRNQQPLSTSEPERKREARIQALIWRGIGRTWSSNGDYDQAYECCTYGKQVLQDEGITSGPAWACLHLEQGYIHSLLGNYDEARRYVLEALEIFEQAISKRCLLRASPTGPNTREEVPSASSFHTQTERAILGDPLDVGRAHETLGLIDASVGQFTESLNHLYCALAIFEQHELVIGMVKVCANLGAIHAVKSENEVARHYIYRSLELAERMSNLPIIALSTGNLGEMAGRAGQLLEAEVWFRRSLAISERTNEREHQCWCHSALAVVLQDQGNLAGATESIRRSLALARTLKSPKNVAGTLISLADLRLVQATIPYKLQETRTVTSTGQSEASPSLYTRLLLRARSTVQRALTVEGLETELVVEGQVILANIYFLLGDLETARQEALRAMEASYEYELTRMGARAQHLLGRIFAAHSLYEQADAYFAGALQIFRDYEMRLDYARALLSYGDTLLERSRPGEGDYQKGIASLREARYIFANCHAAIDLKWVNATLSDIESEFIEA